MGWIKSFISWSLLLIPVAVGAVLGIRNSEPVSLDVVVWSSSEYSLGILLVVVLLLSAVKKKPPSSISVLPLLRAVANVWRLNHRLTIPTFLIRL